MGIGHMRHALYAACMLAAGIYSILYIKNEGKIVCIKGDRAVGYSGDFYNLTYKR